MPVKQNLDSVLAEVKNRFQVNGVGFLAGNLSVPSPK